MTAWMRFQLRFLLISHSRSNHCKLLFLMGNIWILSTLIHPWIYIFICLLIVMYYLRSLIVPCLLHFGPCIFIHPFLVFMFPSTWVSRLPCDLTPLWGFHFFCSKILHCWHNSLSVKSWSAMEIRKMCFWKSYSYYRDTWGTGYFHNSSALSVCSYYVRQMGSWRLFLEVSPKAVIKQTEHFRNDVSSFCL